MLEAELCEKSEEVQERVRGRCAVGMVAVQEFFAQFADEIVCLCKSRL